MKCLQQSVAGRFGARTPVSVDSQVLCKTALRAVAVAGCAAGLALASAAARADEVLASASNMLDVEFEEDNNLIVWVDSSNQLWVGGVDPVSGDLVPSSGKGTRVDTDAATPQTFGNGPEFVQSTAGYSIIYTKYQPGTAGNKSASTAFIARADLTPQGWALSSLPNTLGMVEAMGNHNPTQADPPVVFHDGTDTSANATQLYRQGIYDPMPVLVPNTLETDGSSRFVPGLNELLYTTPVTRGSGRGWRQVFCYDVDTGVTTQLTSDSGNKGDVFMWRAPEYDGAYVMMVKVNDTLLRFYTLQYNSKTGQYQWTAVSSIGTPAGAPDHIWSPEPIVYKGKSYISMVRSPSGNALNFLVPTQVWVASMDDSYDAQVSDPSVTNVVRSDPESFVTASGVFIYYQRYSVATLVSKSSPQGVWRSNAGIP